MSTFTINGLFALGQPQSVGNTSYFLYTSTIRTITGKIVPVQIRVYTQARPAVAPYATHTHAIIQGKASIDKNGRTVLVDALQVSPFPGNPEDPEYDARLPDVHTRVDVLARVLFSQEAGVRKEFTLRPNDYVRGRHSDCSVRFFVDSSSPLWRNVPPPRRDSWVHAGGVCHDVMSNGTLYISIDHLTLNACGSITIPSFRSASPTVSSTPERKRKYLATPPPDDASPAVSMYPASPQSEVLQPLAPGATRARSKKQRID